MSKSSVIYRQTNYQYRMAKSSANVYITDENNNQYLDMSGGAAVCSVGHDHDLVKKRISEQLEQLAFAHTSFFTHAPQEELASRITDLFHEPGAKAYFSSGGSEANETALKLAWQYWQSLGRDSKKIVISREFSYHGNTFGTLGVSGNQARRDRSAMPLLDWPRIEPYYPLRFKDPSESDEAYAFRAAEQLTLAINEVGPENVAAFIYEPVVGSSLGVVSADHGYLERIRAICDNYKILLISDEIMCGSGRTGTWYAHAQHNIVADITTLAKSIAGGYQPLAATVAREHIAKQLESSGFAHGHTYIGHPLACAAGCGVLDAIEADDLFNRVPQMGEQFMNALNDTFADHPNVAEIRGRGLFMGIELVADRDSLKGFQTFALEHKLRELALQSGLICYPGEIIWEETCVPHIILAPPFIIEQRHIDECIEKLSTTLIEFFKRV